MGRDARRKRRGRGGIRKSGGGGQKWRKNGEVGEGAEGKRDRERGVEGKGEKEVTQVKGGGRREEGECWKKEEDMERRG